MDNPDAVDQARGDGLQIVTVTDAIHETIRGTDDLAGTPIRDLSVYAQEWNDSFEFDWVDPVALTEQERAIFDQSAALTALVGGLPDHVADIRISRTMRLDFVSGSDALGLWDPGSQSIVIRRDQLGSLTDFAGTLLHEVAHARSGFGDVNRDFENALTRFRGAAAAAALQAGRRAPEPKRKRFWSF